jgi:hypothetical protein
MSGPGGEQVESYHFPAYKVACFGPEMDLDKHDLSQKCMC